MKPLEGDAEATGQHYDQIVEAERARLEQFSPVEYAITLRYLERFVPAGCQVAEIGVGVGHYSEFLARRGCRVTLVDVSQVLLYAARSRLAAAGLSSVIVESHCASATDLPLRDESADAVLLLGPLYHLRELAEREAAVGEAWRVLRPGGLIFAAGINRIAFLRDMFRSPDSFSVKFFSKEFAEAQNSAASGSKSEGFLARYLATGVLDPGHAPPLGVAHLTTISEFRELLSNRFDELVLTGAEAFTSTWQDEWNSKSADEKEQWLEIIETTGKTVEGLAYSDHFLYIGRRH
jgi:ubiquinone/menaquinone biosynthesis C-methylase UbiE